jgi:hypothetical protein
MPSAFATRITACVTDPKPIVMAGRATTRLAVCADDGGRTFSVE